MRRVWFAIVGVLSLSIVVTAQSSDRFEPGRLEVFGGYSYVNTDFSLVTPNGASGWDASVNFKVRPWIGFVADISGLYPSYTFPGCCPSTTESGRSYTFLFGPQVSLPRGRFSPFARFLTGVAHVTPRSDGSTTENFFTSNNALGFVAGGGLDYSLTRHIAIRGQLDWLYARLTPIGGGDPGVNYVKNRSTPRIATGVVFRF